MAHVLIVEDDTDIREDLAFTLEHEGYQVTTARNGLEALEELRKGSRPCLILLDLMMPVMDGWTFRTEQLADPVLAAVPVLVISGVADSRDHALELKVEEVLPKPIQLERLLPAVKRYCPPVKVPAF
jgi:CheY-like chemotaxis protein